MNETLHGGQKSLSLLSRFPRVGDAFRLSFVGLVVLGLALTTTIGWLSRLFSNDPYFLLSVSISEHPFAAIVIFAISLAFYAVLLRWLIRKVDGWVSATPQTQAPSRAKSFLDWTFAHWYRISFVLALVWSPFVLLSFPGQPNPDFARMIGEFLQTRSEFLPGETPPYAAYPTSQYLDNGSERIWSNHHPFYLMLYYGFVSSLSLTWFDSFLPGIMFLSAVSLTFTLVAFGRAFFILAQFVSNWRVRGFALLITAATPLIALWGISHTKNHLFAAAFVWALALATQAVRDPESIRWPWAVETLLVATVLAISVVFGWIVLVTIALMATFMLSRKRILLLGAFTIPAIAVYASLSWAISTDRIIPSDPIESKALALQTLALVLREDPEAISAADRESLSKIFDLDAMAASFDPDLSDPLKSTGPYATKSDSFRYKTVQPEDWHDFNDILRRTIQAAPLTALDAAVLSSYRYLDPLDKGTNWYPPWTYSYERSVAGHQLSPLNFNDVPRYLLRGSAYGCNYVMPCRVFQSHGMKTVLVVILCTVAIATRRPLAWLWSAPFILQLGIMAASPMSAGGRYALGFTYSLGLLVLMLAITDDDSQIPIDSQNS